MKRYLFAACLISGLSFGAPAWAQDAEPEAKAEGEDAKKTDGDEEAAEKPAEKPAAKPAAAGSVLGPGGKPLRTDYPGTEESLKARMETQGIQGMQVDPNAPAAAYGLRIRELETRIDDLKEKVFQSKTRIVLLRETLLSGNLAGARAIVVHKTDLGSAWRLEQAYYALDGTKLMNRTDKDGGLKEKRVFEVYDGSVSPGGHTVSVLVKYKGTSVGIFPYFKGYSGDIKSSCDFRAEEGKIAQVKVLVYPEGGVAESIEQRPQVKCEVEYFENLRGEAVAADPDKKSGKDAEAAE
jgi:hypothetical protein